MGDLGSYCGKDRALAKKSKSSSRPVAGRSKAAAVPKLKKSGAIGKGKAKPSSKPAAKAVTVKKAATKPVAKPRPAVKATSVKSLTPSPKPPAAPVPDLKPATPHAPFGALASNNGNGDMGSLPIEQLRKVKGGLNAKDLAHFRELLREKRAELLGDVKSMHDGARQASGGNLSHMPVHMADIGSDNYDQEFTLGLVESEARLLREIDEALIRIREGYYGICVVSGKPIARARLEAKPWAKYSIEIAREMEKRGLR